jgi:hypothetical protein
MSDKDGGRMERGQEECRLIDLRCWKWMLWLKFYDLFEHIFRDSSQIATYDAQLSLCITAGRCTLYHKCIRP